MIRMPATHRPAPRSSSGRRIALALAAVAALLLSVAPAQAEDVGKAKEAFLAGKSAYNLGEFTKAIDHYKEGYSHAARPDFLYNIALCYYELKNWERARFFYERYLSELPDAPDAEDVKNTLRELDAKIASGDTGTAAGDPGDAGAAGLGGTGSAGATGTRDSGKDVWVDDGEGDWGSKPAADDAVGWRTEKKRIKGLLIAGPIVLGVGWLVTILYGGLASAFEYDGRYFYEGVIPVVGGFVMAADLGSQYGFSAAFVPVFMSIIQSAGLAMLIVGLVVKRNVKVPVVSLGPKETAPKLALLPGPVGMGGWGLNVAVFGF